MPRRFKDTWRQNRKEEKISESQPVHSSPSGADLREGRVLSFLGKGYDVEVEGEEWFCRVRGRLFLGDGVTWPVVGDKVWVEPKCEPQQGVICGIFPRQTILARRAPETRTQQVLVANVDLVLVCMSLKDPPFRAGLVDRYLASCEALSLQATLLCNKTDLGTEQDIHHVIDEFVAIGYPVICTSTHTGQGIEALRANLCGGMAVLTGPSGSGKSSLVNALFPDIDLKTGDVNEVTGKGRHTTTASRVIPTGQGYLVDTPGLREFSLWDVSAESLASCFVEFRPYLGYCRFRNCRHTVEPGCSLSNAAEMNQISRRRYESYVQLYEELSAMEQEN